MFRGPDVLRLMHLADRLPGQCQRLNATYTRISHHAAGPRGPRFALSRAEKCLGEGGLTRHDARIYFNRTALMTDTHNTGDAYE